MLRTVAEAQRARYDAAARVALLPPRASPGARRLESRRQPRASGRRRLPEASGRRRLPELLSEDPGRGGRAPRGGRGREGSRGVVRRRRCASDVVLFRSRGGGHVQARAVVKRRSAFDWGKSRRRRGDSEGATKRAERTKIRRPPTIERKSSLSGWGGTLEGPARCCNTSPRDDARGRRATTRGSPRRLNLCWIHLEVHDWHVALEWCDVLLTWPKTGTALCDRRRDLARLYATAGAAHPNAFKMRQRRCIFFARRAERARS